MPDVAAQVGDVPRRDLPRPVRDVRAWTMRWRPSATAAMLQVGAAQHTVERRLGPNVDAAVGELRDDLLGRQVAVLGASRDGEARRSASKKRRKAEG